jgi:hypothetical protein
MAPFGKVRFVARMFSAAHAICGGSHDDILPPNIGWPTSAHHNIHNIASARILLRICNQRKVVVQMGRLLKWCVGALDHQEVEKVHVAITINVANYTL